MSRSCVVATGSWRPKWPVWALIIAVYAGIIGLILAKMFVPDLVENIPYEHRPPEYHEEKMRTAPQRLMFAVGVAIVFETVRRLLK
jgi:hypothetical protein